MAHLLNIKIQKTVQSTHTFYSQCGVSRAVYLMMVSDLIKYEFIETFHRMTESQGKPRGVYSDYANTFEAGANLLNFIAIKYRD